MSLSPESRRARRVQIMKRDPKDPVDLFALRDALAADDDAEVRASALLRLDAQGARRLLPYVRDATLDASMRVREAAFVALARAKDSRSLHRAAHACAFDRGFRVRRMALLFAARTFGHGALGVLTLASGDPFWRVRAAARRAVIALDATLDMTDAGEHASTMVATFPEISDPDPAVVTARLERMKTRIDPRDLVAMLAQPHQALRRIAITEISARGDTATLAAVTRWLVDERVPYAPAAAEAALARAGARCATVAGTILENYGAEAAGPIAWALRTAPRAPAWPSTARLVAHDDTRVRRAAVLRVPEAAPSRSALLETMAGILHGDDDDVTRGRAVAWLARTASREARDLLLRLDPRATEFTFVRSVLVGVHADARNIDALRRFARDEHGAVRAAAIAALAAAGELGPSERDEAERDVDPWVRHVALGQSRAAVAIEDASPLVREAAFDAMDREARVQWAASATNEPDAVLRARAANALAADPTVHSTVGLLRLARDSDLGVRSIAVDALSNRIDLLRRLLDGGQLPTRERMAAYTLLRTGGVLGADQSDVDPVVRAHLALIDDVIHERAPRSTCAIRSPSTRFPSSLRRPLGRTGIAVHPFGLSGAHGLAFDDFACAHERGVDLFFWEKSHRELARFLRNRRDAVVVTGTYNADAASIEGDVTRALRALRRDALDVFLAFWTRSVARIDETREILRRLVERGLVRAVGVSTHDRALACGASSVGFDVVMVRHSAAHRGAERVVFPHCEARGTGVLTFSNLCYGRMLHRTPARLSAPVTAPDCYRYSLSQPGVHACIAAPRRHSELMENLAVVETPGLSHDRVTELRAHGDHVYQRSKAWSAETRAASEPPRHEARSNDREALHDWIDVPHSISPDVW